MNPLTSVWTQAALKELVGLGKLWKEMPQPFAPHARLQAVAREEELFSPSMNVETKSQQRKGST